MQPTASNFKYLKPEMAHLCAGHIDWDELQLKLLKYVFDNKKGKAHIAQDKSAKEMCALLDCSIEQLACANRKLSKKNLIAGIGISEDDFHAVINPWLVEREDPERGETAVRTYEKARQILIEHLDESMDPFADFLAWHPKENRLTLINVWRYQRRADLGLVDFGEDADHIGLAMRSMAPKGKDVTPWWKQERYRNKYFPNG